MERSRTKYLQTKLFRTMVRLVFINCLSPSHHFLCIVSGDYPQLSVSWWPSDVSQRLLQCQVRLWRPLLRQVMTVLRRKWSQWRHTHDHGVLGRLRSTSNTMAITMDDMSAANRNGYPTTTSKTASKHAQVWAEVHRLHCISFADVFNTPTHIKRTNKRTNQQAKSKQASKIVMWCKHTDALSSKSVLLICPCLPTSLSAHVPLLFLSFHSPYDCLLLSQLNLFLKGQMNERLNLAKCLHYRLYKIFPRFSKWERLLIFVLSTLRGPSELQTLIANEK